jgi:hypothetical protein
MRAPHSNLLLGAGAGLLLSCWLFDARAALQVVSKKVAAVKYLIEDLLASFPQLDGGAVDGQADGPQPMQLDS